MKSTSLSRFSPGWLRPVLLAIAGVLLVAGCKTQGGVQGASMPGSPPPPSGGMPSPSGGMPSPSGGLPSPSGGSPSPSGGSPSPSGGTPGPDGGSPGGEQGTPMPGEDGSSSPSGAAEGSSGESGEVGSFPSEEDPEGPPPMPSETGGGSAGGHDPALGGLTTDGSSGDGDADSTSDSDWEDNESASSENECGDGDVAPGGVGGMGQAGECVGGGGGSAASANSSAASSASDAAAAAGSSSGGGSASGGTGGAGEMAEFPEESAAERAERLGQELEASIGEFDNEILEEQREVGSVTRVTQGFDIGEGGAVTLGNQGGISLGSQATSGDGGIAVANTDGEAGGAPTMASLGLTEQEIRERTPDDVSTVGDDDIIARQLREAALVESDPELRERLWDEYRKYRGLSTGD